MGQYKSVFPFEEISKGDRVCCMKGNVCKNGKSKGNEFNKIFISCLCIGKEWRKTC